MLPPPPVVTVTPLRSQVRFELLQGARVEYQGRVLKVVAFSGDGTPGNDVQVDLRDDEHLPVSLPLTALVTDPSFRPLDPQSQKIPVLAAYHSHWEKLDGEIRLAALLREQHVLEVMTGYQSGGADQALPGEPRQPYQSERLGDRVRAKAAELGVTTRQVERWLQGYRDKGHHPYGLIDLNAFRLSNRLGQQEAVIGEAILAVARTRQEDSDLTFIELRAKVEELLDEWLRKGKLKTAAVLPSQPTFNDLIRNFAPELARQAKRRHSDGSRDQNRRFRKLVSTRAGQYVMIDVTPFDLLARSEVDGHEIRLRLILAIDHHTRAIVAVTFVEYEPRGVDIANVLLDIIFPVRPHPDWPPLPEGATLPYAGLPEAILLAAHEMPEGAPLMNLPPLLPEAVVVDNGKVFLSREFLEMCARLEIDVLFARPGTGSDKAHVERAFRTVREGIAQRLRGYLGPTVLNRGRKVKAFHFSWEVRFQVLQWIALSYNHATHSELSHPSMPKVKLSPSQMYAISLSHGGYMTVPLGQETYFLALRTELRTIGDVGIRSDGYQYDSDVLNGYRNTQSPYLELKGKWPIKVDRRDQLQIHWQDPHTLDWHRIPARDADWQARPFQDAQVEQIKAVLEERDFAANNYEETRAVNKELRHTYHEQVRTVEKLARERAKQELSPAQRNAESRRSEAKNQNKQRTQAGRAQATSEALSTQEASARRSPEWDVEQDTPSGDLLEVVGDEF